MRCLPMLKCCLCLGASLCKMYIGQLQLMRDNFNSMYTILFKQHEKVNTLDYLDPLIWPQPDAVKQSESAQQQQVHIQIAQKASKTKNFFTSIIKHARIAFSDFMCIEYPLCIHTLWRCAPIEIVTYIYNTCIYNRQLGSVFP